VGDDNLQFENNGGFELLREKEISQLENLERLNTLLKPVFDQEVFKDHSHRLSQMGFSKKIKALIYNPLESQLHPGEMMRHLWRLAGERNIEILTGARVKRIESTGNGVKIRIRGALETDKMGIQARCVGVCTNGFTRHLFPEIKLKPGRGLVLVTEPIDNLPFKGTFHMDRGFYYFRNAGNRLIFGGGRNLQIKEEETTDFGINRAIKDTLEGYLKNIILPKREFKIEKFWSGIMAFGDNKTPIIQQQAPGIFVGVRLGGMGVAIGSNIGEKLADLMTGNAGM
jgi:glycine/D-amino acid oxidase-like deaminating enzyme